MKILNQNEVLKTLDIPRQTFEQGIRPLMEERGDARNLSEGQRTCWAYSDEFLWQWKLYLATRQNLINAGRWNSKRPHSMEDFQDIAEIGMYEDFHPDDPTPQQPAS